MITVENQSVDQPSAELIDLIKTNLTALKPDLDWNQIEFEKDEAGHLVRLRSTDPLLQQWLQQSVCISRPEQTKEGVTYPNAFSSDQTQTPAQ